MTASIPRAHRPRQRAILAELATIDAEAVRPLRAIASGGATQADHDRLGWLESQAASLRAELAALTPSTS